MPGDDEPMRARVREILLRDWDPSNAARFEAASGEYDGYIMPLLELIRSAAPEQAFIDYLHERELECMCFPPAGTSHLRRVAQKLISLRDTADFKAASLSATPSGPTPATPGNPPAP